MSSRQRKRRGGAVGSTQAQRGSRLLPSSAGGTSQTEPTELEESGTLSFEHGESSRVSSEPEVIDLTGEYSEAEVLPLSDNESAVQDREQNQQQPNVSTAGENSAEPLARDDGEESRDNYDAQPAGPDNPPTRENDNSELLEAHEQPRRNVTPSSHEQPAGSVSAAGAEDVPVAAPAPAGQAPAEEGTAHSASQPRVVIRCPICLDFYHEIVKSGRLIVATVCGHVFCSRCLPVALETAGMCPSCRTELTPELYIPLYL